MYVCMWALMCVYVCVSSILLGNRDANQSQASKVRIPQATHNVPGIHMHMYTRTCSRTYAPASQVRIPQASHDDILPYKHTQTYTHTQARTHSHIPSYTFPAYIHAHVHSHIHTCTHTSQVRIPGARCCTSVRR
jgi:hypothetical protein